MKCVAVRSDLADAIRQGASLCRDNALPALQFLRLSGGRGKLLVSATDLQDTLHIEVETQGKKSGSTLVNAKRLRDFLAADQAEEVALELKEDQLVIRGRIEVKLATIRADVADNYPTLPEFPAEGVTTFDRNTIFSVLKDGMKFITRDVKAQRQQPGSVLLKEGNGLLWAGAVDRGFIAFIRQSICEAPEGFQVPVSGSAWGFLQAAKESDSLEIATGDGMDYFRCGNLTVIARRDETQHQNYPTYFKRLDNAPALKIPADRSESLLEAMRSMVALEGQLRMEQNGNGVLHVYRRTDAAQGTWEARGLESDGEAPLNYATVWPELWIPSLEIMVREGTDIALRYTEGSVRLDGGSETYILIAGVDAK